jgi:hypothetical protein
MRAAALKQTKRRLLALTLHRFLCCAIEFMCLQERAADAEDEWLVGGWSVVAAAERDLNV